MSTKEKEKVIRYDEELQKVLLQFMISDSEAFTRCQNIIKPIYWENKLRSSCRYILEYANKYQALPTTEQIFAETGVKIEKVSELKEAHTSWFMETIENFCRHKAMEILVYDGPDLIEKGMYSELERRSKENMIISLQKELGVDYFANPLERLKRMKNRPSLTSTGWKDIDSALYGGFNRGEISIWAGSSGSGKSLFLQNLALNWVNMGFNILYITLELSEDLVSMRFDAMNTEIGTKFILKDVEDVAMRLGMLRKTAKSKLGKLQIKKMSEAGTSVNDIRAYIKEYEIQTNTKFDGLVVDYLDLLHPNDKRIDPGNLFTKDKFVTEELRALASELNVLLGTASQLNRTGVGEIDYDQSHIAGGISKINTADNVMAIYTSAQMRERGEYQIQFLKTRSSAGVGMKINLKFDPVSLRITNLEEGDEVRQSGPTDAYKQILENKTKSKITDNNTVLAKLDETNKIRNMIRRQD